MDKLRDPVISILLVILIGVLCGFIAHQLSRRSWLAQQIAGATRGLLTHALVGIAGAFLGFHAAMLAGLGTGNALVPYIATAVVAALVLWGWRAAKS
jgi:uncharacterized membrane protein YeaQ/YmgE (transglycosylase-associated protein family)